MKKVYEKPMMMCDVFTADEFVAACDPTSVTTYTFECNAKAILGLVFFDNGDGQWGPEDIFHEVKWPYTPCEETTSETHDITSKLQMGWIYDRENPSWEAQKVYIWTGEDGKNVHCTKNIQTAEEWLEANFS